MGVAVSGWRLAKTVSQLGQLGVVSGTALSVTVAHRLQRGDPEGRLRHALDHFPVPVMAERVLGAYFLPGGKPADVPFKSVPMPSLRPTRAFLELTVIANFAEVFLAKEGHQGVVGINLLEKIQLPTLPSLLGAMLAGVDYVLMGAGIPRAIPGVLDNLFQGRPAELKIDTQGEAYGEDCVTGLDPRDIFGNAPVPELKRPEFLGIVSSATLAMGLARKSSGRVNGFVVEGETAGGHNAPPRGRLQIDANGEPVYGPRDTPDLERIRSIGLPFWLAGSYGRPGRLAEARALGAVGIQVGTAFAFCNESGLSAKLRQRALALSKAKAAHVFTDPVASPTGFPFKVVQMQGTLSEAAQYEAWGRICDFGYLRHLYHRPDGSVGYRCPAEPVEAYLGKGGTLEETIGRKCVCNGLLASVGLGQIRSSTGEEMPLMTAGNDLAWVANFLPPGQETYSAQDVIRVILEGTTEAVAPPRNGGATREPPHSSTNDAVLWPTSFAEAFCERFGCRSKAYETKVLWRCLACRLSLIGRLINFTMPRFFDEDREAIRRLGVARNVEDFMRELDDLDYVARRQGEFLRLRAGVRLSVRRLDRLQARRFYDENRSKN